MSTRVRRVGPVVLASTVVLFGVACAGPMDASSEGEGAAASQEATSPTSPSTPSDTSGCLRTDGNCLGPLLPGTYASTSFAVFGTTGPGQFSYTITDARWANALDHPAGYWFQTAPEYEASDGDTFLPGVYLYSDAAAARQDYPACEEESDPTVATDAASLVAWIERLPAIRATRVPALETTSGDALGVMIEAKPDAKGACYDHQTVSTLIASRPDAIDGYVVGITENERMAVYFQDLPGGHTVAILVDMPDKAAVPPGLMAAAQQLVSSFHFTDTTSAS